MKKIIVFLLCSAFLFALFTGCGGGEEDAENNGRGILAFYSVKKAANLYEGAANRVKSEGAGFTKAEWQKISDIKTSDRSDITDRVLDIVASSLLVNEEEAFRSKAVAVGKGDMEKIARLFPVYGKDYACILEEKFDCISSSEYEKDGDTVEITLYFADALNPAPDGPGFGQIMMPFNRESVIDAVRKYAFLVDRDSFAFDLLYRGCYLKCVIDSRTSRIISMEQHMTAEMSAFAEAGLFGFTKEFTGTAVLESHLYFYDFVY